MFFNDAHKNTLKQVESRIVEHRLIEAGERLLVAVSGGVDSIALLHLLSRMAPRHAWGIVVVHVNHQLRGFESDRDAQFVAQLCDQLQLPFYIVDGSFIERSNLQKRAREIRYQAFEKLLRQLRINKLIVAHHADDQAELLLMRLISGCGLKGAAGMPLQRINSAEFGAEFTIIRPLLFLRKARLLSYAIEQRLIYVEDSSNSKTTYRRNRLRHEVLPILEKIQTGAWENLVHFSDIARSENAYMESVARQWLAEHGRVGERSDLRHLDLRLWNEIHPALQVRILQEWVGALSLRPLKRTKVEALLRIASRLEGGESLKLTEQLYVYRDYHQLTFSLQPRSLPTVVNIEVSLQRLPKTVTLCRELAERKVVISRRTCLNEPNLHSRERCREGGIDLDLTRLPEVVTLRSWRPGDTIRLPWSGHRRKLKRYFIDKKINKLQRGQSLVVQAGDRVVGVINDISVPGGTLVDHDYTLSRDSKDLLRIVLEGSNL